MREIKTVAIITDVIEIELASDALCQKSVEGECLVCYLHVSDGHISAVLSPTKIRGDVVRQLHRVRVITTHRCDALKKSK